MYMLCSTIYIMYVLYKYEYTVKDPRRISKN